MMKLMMKSVLCVAFLITTPLFADFYVSPSGNDGAEGSERAPFATPLKARDAARQAKKPVTIHLRGGVYYMAETLVLGPGDSNVAWCVVEGETPVLSGGVKLNLKWEPYKDGIYKAQVPEELKTEEIFVNGERQVRARYPNFDPKAQYFDGFAADAIDKERAARWADPAGGYFHAMHPALWGDFTWVITGKSSTGEILKQGGWQNNRGGAVHRTIRFVENIFEELDAPGEWYLNGKTHTLYFYPPAGLDLARATIEVTRLTTLVEFRGTETQPVRSVTLKGIVFRHANRTVMETNEPLVRSDWAIHRGGAIFFNGAVDCTLEDALIDQVGGNAVFVNNYNRRVTVRGCEIVKAGASGVAFVGDPAAARNPLLNYGLRQKLADIDLTPGPKTNNYPADCLIDDCLIHLTGRVEKQTAGVTIDLAQGITVRHCSIYDMPRSGINVGDGCWGGHIVEFCDIFDTVKETGDHGSFNSWGRDRYWELRDAPKGDLARLALLDAVKPNILRNSRWRCDLGWDIDLDDGSSNYEIYNNLCLNGGLKLREGFFRKVTNNITVNNSLHPHVWYPDSGDIVMRNIFMGCYRPAVMQVKKWGAEIDRNFFTAEGDRKRFSGMGCDSNSVSGDPLFVNPAVGDFSVKANSPALIAGFKNFPMDQFGVQKPSLKAKARTPEFAAVEKRDEKAGVAMSYSWLDARLHTLVGEEYSAYGVAKEGGGVALERVPAESPLAGEGFKSGDLIQSVDEKKVANAHELLLAVEMVGEASPKIGFVRGQARQFITLRNAPVSTVESAANAAGFAKLALPASPFGVVTASRRTLNDPIATLTDGKLANGYGPVFANGVSDGAYKMDLGRVRSVVKIASWSFHQGGRRGGQIVSLYGSKMVDDPGWNTEDGSRFTSLGTLDTLGMPQAGDFTAAALGGRRGQSLGSYRWIVWRVSPVTDIRENTAFQELAVEVAP